MKAVRSVKMALPAVVAVLALVPAAPAVAAAKKLVLKASGTTVSNGSKGSIGITIDECGIFSNGTVVTNSAPKDVLKGTTSSNPECPKAGESISGLITELQLKTSGAATLKGSITISRPGPCSYAFKNPKGTFEVPGFVFVEGTSKGKLVKGSSKSCAKTDVATYFATAAKEPFGEPFEAALS
jgi:hypothetical protein